MKKRIARMVTAIFVITAFAGLIVGCTPKTVDQAVFMQEMIDQLYADFENETRTIYQTPYEIAPDGKTYEKGSGGYTFEVKPLDEEFEVLGADKQVYPFEGSSMKCRITGNDKYVFTFDARLEAITTFYNLLTAAEQRAAGMSKPKARLDKLLGQIADYEAVEIVVFGVEYLQISLSGLNPGGTIPQITSDKYTRAAGLWFDYEGLFESQKELFRSCPKVPGEKLSNADRLSDAFDQLLAWKDRIEADTVNGGPIGNFA